jgi:hypothetical protein
MRVHGRVGLDRSRLGPRVGEKAEGDPTGAVTVRSTSGSSKSCAKAPGVASTAGRSLSVRTRCQRCSISLSARRKGFCADVHSVERDPDLTPDYTTLHRNRVRAKPPALPAVRGGVCLIVDAAGCQTKVVSPGCSTNL